MPILVHHVALRRNETLLACQVLPLTFASCQWTSKDRLSLPMCLAGTCSLASMTLQTICGARMEVTTLQYSCSLCRASAGPKWVRAQHHTGWRSGPLAIRLL